MSDRREHRFTMDLRSGRILDGAPEPPIEEIPDEESQQTLEGLRNWGTA